MLELARQDIRALVVGAGILGCGGGGEAFWGLGLVDEVARQGRDLTIVPLEELDDEGMVFVLSAVGGGVSEEDRRRYGTGLEDLSLRERYLDPAVSAITALGAFLGKPPCAILCSEVGAGNMLLPVAAAAAVGLSVVDGDACGRAKPEVAISTTRLAAIPAAPLAWATPQGDLGFVTRARDDDRAEAIARHTAVASGGGCVVARCPASVSRFRRAYVPGSFTRSISLGKAVLAAEGSEECVACAIVNAVDGARVLGRGSIRSWTREKRGGFMEGWLEVEEAGRGLRLWFKNEFLLAFEGERLVASSPDTLMVVDTSKARSLSNWEPDPGSCVGREVAVLQAPCHPLWHCEAGAAVFGPRHFGYDLDPVLVKAS